MADPQKSPRDWRSFVITATAILHSRVLRRQVMFVGMLVAMGQVFLGALPLEKFLAEHPFLMLAYWLSCFGLVFFLMLLALYDMLKVRQEMRKK